MIKWWLYEFFKFEARNETNEEIMAAKDTPYAAAAMIFSLFMMVTAKISPFWTPYKTSV